MYGDVLESPLAQHIMINDKMLKMRVAFGAALKATSGYVLRSISPGRRK